MANALILVDILNDYFTGGLWPIEQMDRVAATAAAVLTKARAAGETVIQIQHEALDDSAPFFRPGTEGARIHPNIAPEPQEPVILEHRPNSFHQTDLHARLLAKDITHITIIGAMSQMCIDATVRAARVLGYDVTVIAEACGPKTTGFGDKTLTAAQVQAAFLSARAQGYATVI